MSINYISSLDTPIRLLYETRNRELGQWVRNNLILDGQGEVTKFINQMRDTYNENFRLIRRTNLS